MNADRVMAIVGAGHAGGMAAQTLREAGWAGGIAMIGAEPHLPYERPPLSKGLLTGERDAQQCQLRARDAWHADNIEHIVGAVQAIDAQARTLQLADGRSFAYEALLLATGGHLRRLSIPGAQLDGVFGLRTLDDAATLAPRLSAGARVLVIGGGFIGLEVAASARSRGCEVCVVEGAARLLGRCVPAAIGAHVHALHERNGVRVVLNASARAIAQRDDGALAVTLDTGDVLDADTVVVGIGIEPADELARATGLETGKDAARGIVVSETLQTSASGIYAAGDVALFPSRFGPHRIRQETWHNAQTQACVAARNMLGAGESYREVPWFWSDQYDRQLQVAGEPALGVRTVVREVSSDISSDMQIHFALDGGGNLVAASGFGAPQGFAREMRLARMLVERAAPVDADDLANPDVKLKSLL
ncbi:FAD-dependent oxidoreductase [Burkholderia sp. Ax-1719]|uniref:NAD(P)/FAD-dependent oxidoreductase n=1 Tax=Burkholderia sp. Ax-1719 TaxID=2608334 RepID=UPI00141F0CDC|nr:FAD-dependent oxidoreductase [Burkholderia sp. Ax-1719]NIE64143.1 pyridine nucleotide-disulfide oxidoreductase [Burkholderia sp. Ax-1719]